VRTGTCAQARPPACHLLIDSRVPANENRADMLALPAACTRIPDHHERMFMRRLPTALPLLFLAWMVAFVTLSGQTGQAPKPASAGQAATAPAAAPPAKAAAAQPAKAPVFDLTKPTLFVVGYAHLDTEWRWDYATTIREYLPKTIRVNFDLLEKYPHYVFNFSGANRYRMIKEYYPDDYARIRKYVAAGRWFPSGSSMEENDVNSPSAESIIRQILYGKEYFRREFGKTSAEFMLPDCFGFPASLPSVLAHVGIKGFSTQKLSASWQPAPHVGGPDSPEKTPAGIPFNVGIWEGPDGKTVIAALNPGSYGGSVTYDLSTTPPPPPPPDPAQPNRAPRPNISWPDRITINGQLTGAYTDYMYYGTGDTGGAPNESSVKFMEAIVTKSKTPIPPLPPQGGGRGGQTGQQAPPPVWPGEQVLVGDGPVKVVSANAEQMFLNIKPEQAAKMPRYKGDLELINHSAGSITSQTYMKRWNRQNEVLADDAERASVLADWLGGRAYPLKRLNDAWTLVMGGQFHDIIPGTSIPKAYEYSWNDEILASNQFAGVLASATEAVASVMNTQAKGTAIVVYNPLNIEREDVVEATVNFPGGTPRNVKVTGSDGKDVRAQWTQSGKALFVAKVPSVGFAVFDVQSSDAVPETATELKATSSSLENGRYTVKIDDNGDIATIFDKSLNKDLLSAPARLEIKTDNPAQWPAWNMDYQDQMRAPRAYVSGPAKVRVVESGAVRVALEITRQAEGSTFVQTIRLSSGDAGNRIEFANAIDWNTKESHLKAVFPLTASNEEATYNWDVGTIRRTTNIERQFEVASHQWVDLTDKGGAFGATILTDCKNASDKPNENTVRLTLVRTPGIRGGYEDQSTLDLGHHEFVYGLAGHSGDFRQGQTDWQAQRLNQPLLAFASPQHDGKLGKSFSLLTLNNSRIRVLALKKAEQTDEFIVRLVELDGTKQDNVRVTFGGPVLAAREVNGAEEPVGAARVSNGVLVTSFTPFQPRTFAVKLAAAPTRVAAPLSRPVALPYNQAVASPDRSVSAGNFDNGRALAAEMLPSDVAYGAIHFQIAPTAGVKPNAVIPRGQTIALPAGRFTRLYLLAAAAGDTDQRATFKIDDAPVDLAIQAWGGYVGQWDNRVWITRDEPSPPRQGQPAPPPGAPPRMRTVQEFTGMITHGFVKRAPVAWFASHRHGPDGMAEPYAYSYLFAYVIDIPPGAKTITLPLNDRLRIMAITVSNEGAQVVPAQPLYDTLERSVQATATTDRSPGGSQ
jgi:alpha-mannosidase